MKELQTFTTPDGRNVALVTLIGTRDERSAIDVSWHRDPSKKEQRLFREWFQKIYGEEFGTAHYLVIDDSALRRAVAERTIFGGTSN